MTINKSIINDACAGFLATAYQLAAQDELRCAFSVVRGSGIYEEKLAQISHINNRSDYDSFLKGLSDTDELSEAAVQYFAERWKAKIEPCLEAIEKRMQPELDHPFLDCRSVVRKIERWAMLALGFDITDHEKYPQSEELEIVENLEGYKQLLKEQVAKQIKNIADTPFERRTGKNRFMPGDIVTLNRERSLEAFVHDKDDLDCIHGETIEFKFSDPAPVAELLYRRFVYDKRKNGSVEGATLRISSDRPEHSGKLVTFDVPFDDL